jgi:hypothetical protein
MIIIVILLTIINVPVIGIEILKQIYINLMDIILNNVQIEASTWCRLPIKVTHCYGTVWSGRASIVLITSTLALITIFEEVIASLVWFKIWFDCWHQPDGYNFEQCTAIILDSILNTQIWHDVPCAYNNINYFMCETKQNISNDKGKEWLIVLLL